MTKEELEKIISDAQAEIKKIDEAEKAEEEELVESKEVGNVDAQFHNNEQKETTPINTKECNNLGSISSNSDLRNTRQIECPLKYDKTVMELLKDHVVLQVGDTCKGDLLCSQD